MHKLMGFKFKIGKYNFRIWKTGCEWGNSSGGKYYLFPWHPIKLGIKDIKYKKD